MATAKEHMAADLAYILADTGEGAETLNLDGQDMTGFIDVLELTPADFEGGITERLNVIVLSADYSQPVPDQEVKLKGKRYNCVSSEVIASAVDMVLVRYQS